MKHPKLTKYNLRPTYVLRTIYDAFVKRFPGHLFTGWYVKKKKYVDFYNCFKVTHPAVVQLYIPKHNVPFLQHVCLIVEQQR